LNKVTVVGSINIDLTSYLERWPRVGETVHAHRTLISLGGKGANQAVAARKMGADVTMVGAIGADGFGEDARRWLLQFGVALQGVTVPDAATGMAFIDVGPEGDNMIRLSAGANAALTAAQVTDGLSALGAGDVVLLQNEVPLAASRAAARLARAKGARVIMDPAPAPDPFWGPDIVSEFDILTPNAHEAKLITGYQARTLSEALCAAELLAARGAAGCIISMGEQGVAWSISGETGTQAAPKVNAVDTVAAGDCFNGAFAAFLAQGLCPKQAIERAVYAASLATTRIGAADSIPSAIELEKAMALV
jgi:ribokinase